MFMAVPLTDGCTASPDVAPQPDSIKVMLEPGKTQAGRLFSSPGDFARGASAKKKGRCCQRPEV
jgi:hypothetical protein